MIAIRQLIAVGVDVIELIIEPDRLGLPVGLKQWAGIPKPNVLNRVLVSCDHVTGQVRQSGVGCFLNSIQIV